MTASTPPPVSGESTPGFGDFMTGLTPGFFSAGYHLDNPFDKSFGENNPSYETTAEPFSKSLHAPPDSNSMYGYPSSGSFLNSPYPTKVDITPPQTASEVPADWQFGEGLSGTQIAQTLINSLGGVEGHSAHSRIQYGQATPPDEQSLREPGLDEVNSALADQHRPSTRKRDSSASNKSSRSTKRAKKSRQESQVHEDSSEHGEEGEKRSKFLERNRVAASKCRQKKKEHNAQLEQKAKNLERENAVLKMTMEALQTEKITLMTHMAMHTPETCDCRDMHQHLAHFKAKYNTSFGPDEMSTRSPESSSLHGRTSSIASLAPTIEQEMHDQALS
ncbi:hypothetical protein MMC10_009061 [Thelotrema lepadinum]|nr:hypothetical protein [Thelotrema lepadinum]